MRHGIFLQKSFESKVNIKIIGRSRKQKQIISEDLISEKLNINNKDYNFEYQEGGFTSNQIPM